MMLLLMASNYGRIFEQAGFNYAFLNKLTN